MPSFPTSIPMPKPAPSRSYGKHPFEIPGLRFWIDHRSSIQLNSGGIAGIIDQSRWRDHFGQPSASKQPTNMEGVLNNKRIMRFDGVSDNLSPAGSFVSYERTQPWTSLCVFARQNASSIVFADINTTVFNGVLFCGLDSLGKIDIIISNNFNTNRLDVTGSTALTAGTFYAVLSTYDGSSTPGGIQVFIDGVKETLTTVANTLSASVINTSDPSIGAAKTGNFFQGDIACVGLWPRVLRPGEINDIFRYVKWEYDLTIPL